ncbi:hypothetical protein [Microtetraspora malaysiensis]|uniref:hypothetical protein n=1 Tax=Microtetraspora malaysiensis TaxID=161358 RepID=UPI003D91B44A
MSAFTLTDCTVFIGGYDFTGDSNKVSLKTDVEDKETTVFGSGGWKSRTGGLKDVSFDTEGYWQSAAAGPAVDPEAFSSLGVADRVATVTPTGIAGETAYFFQGGTFGYEMFGQVGDVTPFTLATKATGRQGLIRGQLAKAKGLVSAVGAVGSGLQLGAVGAGQFLYAVVHVFSAGSTITLKVESDDNAGFSSPTDRITLAPITVAGGTWAVRLPGPITDTYYRVNATAITGSFQLAAAIGIGS